MPALSSNRFKFLINDLNFTKYFYSFVHLYICFPLTNIIEEVVINDEYSNRKKALSNKMVRSLTILSKIVLNSLAHLFGRIVEFEWNSILWVKIRPWTLLLVGGIECICIWLLVYFMITFLDASLCWRETCCKVNALLVLFLVVLLLLVLLLLLLLHSISGNLCVSGNHKFCLNI